MSIGPSGREEGKEEEEEEEGRCCCCCCCCCCLSSNAASAQPAGSVMPTEPCVNGRGARPMLDLCSSVWASSPPTPRGVAAWLVRFPSDEDEERGGCECCDCDCDRRGGAARRNKSS